MIAMKLSWLVLEVICLGFFGYFGSSIALALAVVLVLIPLGSIPVNLYIRKNLSISLRADANMRKGASGSFTVVLDNPTIFPAMRVRCNLLAQNQLNREFETVRVMTWMPPKKQSEAALTTGSDYCGRIRISVQKIVLYDCFGLIGICCKSNAVAHMTVQPDTFEPNITLIPTPHSLEDSDVYSQDRPGSDLTETYQIREYVPGDSPRQIHWKLSNKFDKLIVRDPSLPITRNVLVFWERTGESGNREIIDAQAETVVSLCRGLLDNGIQFTIGWNDTDRNLCILHEICDMDELVGIIPRLMRATGVREGVSGAGLLMQSSGEALCSHMVYIAEEPQSEVIEMQRFGHVSMLLCGKTSLDGAILFDPEHYEEQLSQIDL